MGIVKELYSNGFVGFPLARNSKVPERGIVLADVDCDLKMSEYYYRKNRLGWHLGKSNAAVIDFDYGKSVIVDRWIEDVRRCVNAVNTPSGGVHLYFKFSNMKEHSIYKNTHVKGIDVKFSGNTYVKAYRYRDTFKVISIKFVDFRDMLFHRLGVILKDIKPERSYNITKTPEELVPILKGISADIHYVDWGSVACAIKALCGDEGEELFLQWSRSGSSYTSEGDTVTTYRNAAVFNGNALIYLENVKKNQLYDKVINGYIH